MRVVVCCEHNMLEGWVGWERKSHASPLSGTHGGLLRLGLGGNASEENRGSNLVSSTIKLQLKVKTFNSN